jgi:hypothetical protein
VRQRQNLKMHRCAVYIVLFKHVQRLARASLLSIIAREECVRVCVLFAHTCAGGASVHSAFSKLRLWGTAWHHSFQAGS